MPVYVFTGLFTATTYLLAGFAREQVCTYMCPWPRFQAAMLDEQSITVTYQAWRGEPRHAGRRSEAQTAPKFGDCVDCDACVHVCPTGIDIREGSQLGCINCGLCIDACNHVMEKVGTRPYLISWDTLARQKGKAQGVNVKVKFLRVRTILYMVALAVVGISLLTALVTRSTATLSVIHDRAPLYVTLRDGSLRNGYTIKIANKTQADANYVLKVSGVDHALITMPETGAKGEGAVNLEIAASSVGNFRLLIEGKVDSVPGGHIPVQFILREASGHRIVYQQLFMGPGAEP